MSTPQPPSDPTAESIPAPPLGRHQLTTEEFSRLVVIKREHTWYGDRQATNDVAFLMDLVRRAYLESP